MRRPNRHPYYDKMEDITNWVETADFVIYKDGAVTVAVDGNTGAEVSRNTNATTPITYAINNLPVHGGTIFFKPGTYTIDATLPITYGMNIVGSSVASTVISAAVGMDAHMFSYDTAELIYFPTWRHIQLSGSRASNTGNRGIDCNAWVQDGLLFDIMIIDFDSDGAVIDNTWGWRIVQCVIEYCNENGLICQSSGNGSIMGNKIIENGKCGIYAVMTSATNIIGNFIRNNGEEGLKLQEGVGNTILGNYFSGNSTAVANALDDLYIYQAGSENIIVGNTFHASTDARYNINIAALETGDIITSNFLGGGATGTLNTLSALMIKNNDGYVDENGGVTGNVADGGTFAHGLSGTPTYCVATGSVAGDLISVSGLGAANVTVAIKDEGGGAGTAQPLYWRAWL